MLYVSQLRLQSIYVLGLAYAALTGKGIFLLFSLFQNSGCLRIGFPEMATLTNYKCIMNAENISPFVSNEVWRQWLRVAYLPFHNSWNQSTLNTHLGVLYQHLQSSEGSVSVPNAWQANVYEYRLQAFFILKSALKKLIS